MDARRYLGAVVNGILAFIVTLILSRALLRGSDVALPCEDERVSGLDTGFRISNEDAAPILPPPRTAITSSIVELDNALEGHEETTGRSEEGPERRVAAKQPYLTSDKVAVMVETRMHPHLLPAIDNFVSHLPWDWRIQLFLSTVNEPFVKKAPVLKELVDLGKIVLSRVPHFDASKHRYKSYNAIVKNVSFWESIVGERVLIFQTDAALCRGSPHTVDDFDDFDYVGGPWNNKSYCGNGGFSLRSRKLSIETLTKFAESKPNPKNEDLWFCSRYSEMGLGPKIASWQTAMKFSVEKYYYDRPVGVHKIFYELHEDPETLEKVYDYCPESRTLSDPDCRREACARMPSFVATINRTRICTPGWKQRAKEMLRHGQRGACKG